MRRRTLLTAIPVVAAGCLGRLPPTVGVDDVVGTLTVTVLNRTDDPQPVVVTIRNGADLVVEAPSELIPPNVSRTTTHTVAVGDRYDVRVDGDGWGVGGPWQNAVDCHEFEITVTVYEDATEATVSGCRPGVEPGDAVVTVHPDEQ